LWDWEKKKGEKTWKDFFKRWCSIWKLTRKQLSAEIENKTFKCDKTFGHLLSKTVSCNPCFQPKPGLQKLNLHYLTRNCLHELKSYLCCNCRLKSDCCSVGLKDSLSGAGIRFYFWQSSFIQLVCIYMLKLIEQRVTVKSTKKIFSHNHNFTMHLNVYHINTHLQSKNVHADCQTEFAKTGPPTTHPVHRSRARRGDCDDVCSILSSIWPLPLSLCVCLVCIRPWCGHGMPFGQNKSLFDSSGSVCARVSSLSFTTLFAVLFSFFFFKK
jgi:hypothetical protein